jgi:glycosyltransferase involved in cell wall biosynthesis
MVRVLMCGPISTLGGVSTHTKYLTKNLVNNGINVILYQFDSPERYNDLIHLLLKMYRRTFGLVITGFLNRKKYDLIHTQTSGGLYSFISAVTGSIVAKIANKKLIVTFHNSAKLKLLVTKYNYIFAFVLNNVEKIILVSNTQKETLSEYFPMYSSKMIVIPNGYDSSLFFAQDMHLEEKGYIYQLKKKLLFRLETC